MSGRARSITVALILVAVLLGAGVWLDTVRERAFPLPASEDESLYLTARAAGRTVFAFRPLAADLYWIRTIQYYGGHKLHIDAETAHEPPVASRPPSLSYDQLYALLDVTTTLDPRFNIAYRFGSIFLAEAYPAGAGRPDQAIALLEKGLREIPGKWQYLEDIGFIYYWDVHDFKAAARYLNLAGDRPGAPWWLRSVAATMLARGGDREASRTLWRHMYETATDDRERQATRLKLLQLGALDQIEALQRAVDAVVRRTGSTPASWEALVRGGVLRGIPVDPAGVPYELTPEGRVELSHRSPLYPLPIEPSPSLPAAPSPSAQGPGSRPRS